MKRTEVVLGPLFTIGAALAVAGLLRRSVLLVAAGAVAMVADQRLLLSQRLKDALRSE